MAGGWGAGLKEERTEPRMFIPGLERFAGELEV